MLTPMMAKLQNSSLSSTESARLQNSLKKPFSAKICLSGAISTFFLMAEITNISTGFASEEMAVASPAPATPIAGRPNTPKMKM